MKLITDTFDFILLGLLIVFGAGIVFPLANVALVESKAGKLAKRISSFPDQYWEVVFSSAEELHREVFSGETIRVSSHDLDPVLADLGFDSCLLTQNRVVFRFGGRTINTAGVEITLIEDADGWTGVRIKGWQEYRKAFTRTKEHPARTSG